MDAIIGAERCCDSTMLAGNFATDKFKSFELFFAKLRGACFAISLLTPLLSGTIATKSTLDCDVDCSSAVFLNTGEAKLANFSLASLRSKFKRATPWVKSLAVCGAAPREVISDAFTAGALPITGLVKSSLLVF